MTTEYRYVGIFLDNDPPDEPSGVVRLWTDANGEQRKETFRASLDWEPSEVFSPVARGDYRDFVEVDQSVVDRFIERVRRRHGGG